MGAIDILAPATGENLGSLVECHLTERMNSLLVRPVSTLLVKHEKYSLRQSQCQVCRKRRRNLVEPLKSAVVPSTLLSFSTLATPL